MKIIRLTFAAAVLSLGFGLVSCEKAPEEAPAEAPAAAEEAPAPAEEAPAAPAQ